MVLGRPNKWRAIKATSCVAAGALLFVLGAHGHASALSKPSATVTVGSLSLTATPTENLSEDATTITVSGQGYNPNVGIYVTLCVMRPAGEIPSPCGGYRGTSASAIWIGSHPEANFPMPSNGTFTTELTVGPVISPAADCRAVQCAIVTRTDHTRLDDRSYDVQIPVKFRGVAPTTTTTTVAPKSGTKSSNGQSSSSNNSTSSSGSVAPDETTDTVPNAGNDSNEIAVDDVVEDLKKVALESEEGSSFNALYVVAPLAVLAVGGSLVLRRRRLTPGRK